ncbi:MAG: SpoIIE family protein phosphatase [Bacteroidaceae bacterium]|nr:SpoIIE family protein phosphatase [Bacteroidaceae bacterium]
MKETLKKLMPRALRSKSSLAIILTAAVLVEVTNGVQYLFAKRSLQEEVEHRAKSELRAKGLEIENVTTAIEVAADNMVWAIESELANPDSIYGIARKLLENNKQIVGAAVVFVADYYPQYGRWCELYVARCSNGDFEMEQIGGPDHDYLQAIWFKGAIAAGKGYWSEPYYDNKGAQMMLSSYFTPVRGRDGKIVALLAADVSLDWLTEVINAKRTYPSSYNILLSRTGQIMACPVESLVMQRNIEQVTADLKDTTIDRINREMMAGQSGKATIYNHNGKKRHVFYAQMDEGTGWSMAVVCPEQEIYHNLRQMRFNLFLLMLIGIALLGYIIWRAAKNAIYLQSVNAEKERIGCELRIASDIQKSMLPKIFPPYPERDDVEIFGSIVPAKEVGGDLFDFYIRDEKLFFCIGDVSGKGVPASLVMAVTRCLFRTVSAHEAIPERIVTHMNDSMAQTNETNMFVTMFVGVLDLPTGRLRYCNAGHCSPMLIESRQHETASGKENTSDNQQLSFIDCISNFPLGIIPNWKFKGQELFVHPQDTIFLYTDGLTEAENIKHAQYGEERMMAEIRKVEAQTPQALIEHMTSAVNAFVGEARQSDDLTMLAVQYTKEQLDLRLDREITLQNDIQQITLLAEFVEEVCESIGLDGATTMQMNLALEEAVVNVIKYAYPHDTVGDINIKAQASDVRLKFVVSDNGAPFDPTAKTEVDTTLTAEERPIGGLGIHLVRKIMDSINYERVSDRNVLTLRKKLNKQ